MDGHIKFYRKFLDWGWYQDINTKVLFIHMLLKANWKDGTFMGTTVPRGSFVSSIKSLAYETGLTEREIRTGISHLKMTGEVTSKATNKYSVFTIKNYDLYQSDDRQDDTQATGERHSNDKRTTTIEERNKEKKKEGNKKENTLKGVKEKEPVKGQHKNDCVGFEQLWQAYPRKKEKAAAYKAYKARLSDGFSEDELETAVKRYAAECVRLHTEERYIKHAATFFGPNTPFADYLKDRQEAGEIDQRNPYGYKLSDI